MGPFAKIRRKEKTSDEEKKWMAELPYRELVEALLYISTRTRPDIGFSVSLAARRVDDPRLIDWEGAKRILRSLKDTNSLGLFFPSECSLELRAY